MEFTIEDNKSTRINHAHKEGTLVEWELQKVLKGDWTHDRRSEYKVREKKKKNQDQKDIYPPPDQYQTSQIRDVQTPRR